mgnify:CR=1 FL=1
MRTMSNSERWYRQHDASDRWQCYGVKVETTDLFIRSTINRADLAETMTRKLRKQVREHAERQPDFLTAMSPVEEMADADDIIQRMYRASRVSGTGPMASVAGAVAEMVGEAIAERSSEVIVENGGDTWMKLTEPARIDRKSTRLNSSHYS